MKERKGKAGRLCRLRKALQKPSGRHQLSEIHSDLRHDPLAIMTCTYTMLHVNGRTKLRQTQIYRQNERINQGNEDE